MKRIFLLFAALLCVCLYAVDVASVHALRQLTTNPATEYTITGAVVVTFVRVAENQLFVQDATGADIGGIMVTSGTDFTETYAVGDELTGLIGTVDMEDGLLIFTTTADPGVASDTGVTVEPLVATFAEITSLGALPAYQSRLVTIENVIFYVMDGQFGGVNPTVSFPIYDGTAQYFFRAVFPEANYVTGQFRIPFSPVNITGLIHTSVAGNHLVARFISDFEVVETNMMLPPRNLTRVVNASNVVLSWQAPLQGGKFSHSSLDRIPDSIGPDSPGTYYLVQRFTPEQLIDMGVAGQKLKSIAFVSSDRDCNFTIRVWVGGSSFTGGYNPGTQVANIQIGQCPYPGDWSTVELPNFLDIPVDRELWFGFSADVERSYPALIDRGPAINGYGNLMWNGSIWTTLLSDNPQLDGNWMLKGMAVDANGRSLSFGAGELRTPTVAFVDYQETPSSPMVRWYQGDLSIYRNHTRTPEVSGYNVYKDADTTPLNGNTLITRTTYTDENVPWGDYTYTVTAMYAGNNESDPTAAVIATIAGVVNNPPRALTGSFTSGQGITLQWQAPLTHDHSGVFAERYSIYRNDMAYIDSHTSTTFHDESVAEPGLYIYRVTARYDVTELAPNGIESVPTDNLNITVWAYNPARNLVAVRNADGNVRLSWLGPASHQYLATFTSLYNIYRDGVALAENRAGREFVDSSTLQGDVEYTYSVVIIYQGANQGDPPVFSAPVTYQYTHSLSDGDNVSLATTALHGNYPNPFNPSTTIDFSLKTPQNVNIDVFNIKGQRVVNLVDKRLEAGNHQVNWNGIDGSGKPVSSGIYFYQMSAGEFTAIKKMILMK